MSTTVKLTDEILLSVSKPARYLGNEWNSIHKKGEIKFALVYPEIYEIGMSNLGMQILYYVLNQQDDIQAERVFAPWVDMDKMLRDKNIPIFSLESQIPLGEFDLIGFSLQHELNYTNVLNILYLGKIPLRACEREAGSPLVIAGGPCAYNPEPLSEFIDAFVIGEGEEAILELIDVYKDWRKRSASKEALLRSLATLEGVYVPSLYEVRYNEDGTINSIEPKGSSVPKKIKKRFVKDLDTAPYPTKPIVPFIEIVHDRIALEIMRGCPWHCRFCQAGTTYRPLRRRSQERLKELARQLVKNTGYNEISLLSLSSTDYPEIYSLALDLVSEFSHSRISVSLPSLRPDSFSLQLAREVQKVRKTGLTFAIEAGTQRLRDVIRKQITEDDLLAAVRTAFEEGWQSLKLYFMIGLPTEREEDLQGIVHLLKTIVRIGRQMLGEKRFRLRVHASLTPFIPKPQTPFQWVGQDNLETIVEKQKYILGNLREREVELDWPEAERSFLEAVFARGDRRLGKVLLEAWKRGAKFDAWSDQLQFEIWQQAFKESGIDPSFYANRTRHYNEILPWEHIDAGISKDYLLAEAKRALENEPAKSEIENI